MKSSAESSMSSSPPQAMETLIPAGTATGRGAYANPFERVMF